MFNFSAGENDVTGSFDSGTLYCRNGVPESVLSAAGGGRYALVLVDGGSEPTVHVLNDIAAVADRFEEWGRPILILFASEEDVSGFGIEDFALPSNVITGIDKDGEIRRQIVLGMNLGSVSLPCVMIADTSGDVTLFSHGYTIGIGEEILRHLSVIRDN